MKTIGRYRIVRPLGQGGMGQIFLAEDPVLERQVAIKLLHQDSGRHALRDEAKVLAALRHPGIVTVFEVGEHEGQDFIAMEYLPGKTLRQLIPEFATRREHLVGICARVASAVAAAHRAGILHRDIKPENIIVTVDDEVKVVDFGIAHRELDDPLANPTIRDIAEAYVRTKPPGYGDTIQSAADQGHVSGTPSYLAPELLYGQSASSASDIYSVGVVLYECLTGNRPHAGRSLVELITNIVETPIPPIDDPLADVVMHMLDKDPAKRWSLDDVGPRLAPRPKRSRKVIAGIVFAMLAAIVAWVIAGSLVLGGPPATTTATIAVQLKLDVKSTGIPTYGNDNPNAELTAQAIVGLFDNVEGARIAGIALGGAPFDRGIATHHLHGSIIHTNGKFQAELMLVGDAGTHSINESDIVFGSLIQTIARKTAERVEPKAVFNRERERVFAAQAVSRAKSFVEHGQYNEAVPLLESAVGADPDLGEAWYYLALTRDWLVHPEAKIGEAIRAAIDKHVGPEHRRTFLRGTEKYFRRDYAGARELLEPMIERTPRRERRDLYYYIGEAYWHDGRHATGHAMFMQALEIDPRFTPATVHATQYSLARRDFESTAYLLGLAQQSRDPMRFAQRKYASFRESDDSYFSALVVLEQEPTEALIEKRGDYAGAHRIARAIVRGDRADAARRFDEVWKRLLEPNPSESAYYAIDQLGEVVIAAGMVDESRRLVQFLRGDGGEHRRSYERFAILTAELTHDATWIPKRLSEREVALATAVRASLAGDHATAIAGLTRLVNDPSAVWDYPERALLVRELRAARRHAEARALCADTLEPAFYRTAFVVVRELCRR